MAIAVWVHLYTSDAYTSVMPWFKDTWGVAHHGVDFTCEKQTNICDRKVDCEQIVSFIRDCPFTLFSCFSVGGVYVPATLTLGLTNGFVWPMEYGDGEKLKRTIEVSAMHTFVLKWFSFKTRHHNDVKRIYRNRTSRKLKIINIDLESNKHQKNE